MEVFSLAGSRRGALASNTARIKNQKRLQAAQDALRLMAREPSGLNWHRLVTLGDEIDKLRELCEMRAPSQRNRVVAKFKKDRSVRGRFACDLCGWSAPQNVAAHRVMQAHHIIPVSHGGPHVAENLTLLCPNCHAVAHAESTNAQR